MSDTSNPGNLASSPIADAAEFDARLKRTDENRWLATRYAPPDGARASGRDLPAAPGAAAAPSTPRRPCWARSASSGGARRSSRSPRKGPVRRHDLAEELARVTGDRRDLVAPINELIDRFDDVIDDHLRAGGHEDGGTHEARHLAAEASLTRLAGLSLDRLARTAISSMRSRAAARRTSRCWPDMPDARDRWNTARVAARNFRRRSGPPSLTLPPDAPKGAARSPLLKRWRMFRAIVVGNLRRLQTSPTRGDRL